MSDQLKKGSKPKNLHLLDYVISIQLEKIENNKLVKSDGYLSEATESAMANLIELLKLRKGFPYL